MENIITGEKIANLADICIFGKNDVIFGKITPTKIMKFENNDFSNICKNYLNVLEKSSKIYINSERLNDFFKNIAYHLKHNYTIYSHNSDKEHTFEELNNFLKKFPNVKRIYCQNIINPFINDKIVCIPIGIANSCWSHGNLEILSKFLNVEKKHNLLYINININTYPSDRKECLKLLSKQFKISNSNKSYEEYLKDISNNIFCACPRGNGIDTHRFWECVYLKTIPIVIKSKFTEYWYNKGIFCIQITSWEEVTIDSMMLWYKEYLNYKHKYEITKLSIYN